MPVLKTNLDKFSEKTKALIHERDSLWSEHDRVLSEAKALSTEAGRLAGGDLLSLEAGIPSRAQYPCIQEEAEEYEALAQQANRHVQQILDDSDEIQLLEHKLGELREELARKKAVRKKFIIIGIVVLCAVVVWIAL